MKKINLGIIGCGHWGPNFVRNFDQMEGVKIAGVCDRSPEKLAGIKRSYSHIPVCSEYNDLLDKQEIEAVVIATPASTHYRIAKEAIKRDKHILVEKPLSLTVKEAEGLLHLAGRTDKVLMVGHTFLFNPAVNKMKEVIESKELGRIYYIHCRRTNLGPLRKDVNAIWDLSPHDISIINYILGRMPLEVSAYAQRFLFHNLEDVGFIILKYPPDILVHIHVSWLDPKKIREATIIGSRKMLVYDDTNLSQPIRVYDKQVMKRKYEKPYRDFQEFQLIIRDGRMNTPAVSPAEPLKLECRHFVDCIREDKMPRTDAMEGLEIVRILEKIKQAYETGKTVRIR